MLFLQEGGVDKVWGDDDFDADPSKVEMMLAMMAAARRGGIAYTVDCHTPPDMPTHNSEHVLDFFVIMTKGNAPSGRVWAAPVEPSNHDPVFMEVD